MFLLVCGSIGNDPVNRNDWRSTLLYVLDVPVSCHMVGVLVHT